MKEELIEEILVCMPVKSLIRCKCLSKEWNHFISNDKRFRRRYLDKCTDPDLRRFLVLGLFVINCDFPNVVRFLPTFSKGSTNRLKTKKKRNDNEEADIIVRGIPLIPIDESLDFTTTHHSPYIQASSNGFLLCCDLHDLDYLICNPITKYCIHLPPVNFRSRAVTHSFICHGTSPYMDTLQSYTVMRATCRTRRWGDVTTLTIEVLSSDVPEEWKIFILQPQFSFHFVSPFSAISENGVIYITASVSNGQCFIIFDRKTSTESLQLLEFPEPIKKDLVFSAMSDGLLTCTHWKDDRITIWVLDHRDGLDFTPQWSVKHSAMLPRIDGFGRVIGCHPLNPLVLFIRGYGKTFLYDTRNSKQEVLCSEHLGPYSEVVPYTYGLVGRLLFHDR
ncbi:hypothetical protein ACHQM5_006905 [Ranunculus cassubicifolius]